MDVTYDWKSNLIFDWQVLNGIFFLIYRFENCIEYEFIFFPQKLTENKFNIIEL